MGGAQPDRDCCRQASLRWMREAYGLVAVAVSITMGCGGSPDSAISRIRDSAGISIVENPEPAWTADQVEMLDSTPALIIGNRDGDPYHFTYITGAVRYPDGTVVVADLRSANLRYFDSSGTYLKTVGRPGEGPGDFVKDDAL